MTSSKSSGQPSVSSLDARVGTIESEISRQTAESHALRSDVERLSHAFDGFARDVRNFMQSTGRLDMRLVATFIGIGISAVALTLTIGGMYLAPTNERVRANDSAISTLEAKAGATAATRWTEADQDAFEDEIREALNRLDDHIDTHTASQGHPMMIERVDALGVRLGDVEQQTRLTHDWGMLHEAQVSSLNATQSERIEEARRGLDRLALLVEKNADAFTEHTQNGHPESVISHMDTLRDRMDDLSEGIQSRQEWLMEANATMAARDAGYHARLDELERQLREISAEQRRRTEKVYDGP